MCTVSRAALLTGRNIWQNREAGTHWSVFPRDLAVYPLLLQEAGYAIAVTGKGWGPGNWQQTGWPHNPAGPEYSRIKCDVPATGIHNIGRMLEILRQRGDLDNTLVVVTGDNGTAIPHAKCNLYEYGVHVPLAVMWPRKIAPRRKIEDPVSFIDLAPTFLEAAGLRPRSDVNGGSLMSLLTSRQSGRLDPARQFVLLGHERGSHERYDNLGYPMRAIRTDRYLYIMNLKPDRWPRGDPILWTKDAANSAAAALADDDLAPDRRKRAEEELFDVARDPACMANLAADPAYQSARNDLRRTLTAELTRQGDPRLLDCGDIFESYPRFGPMHPELGGFAEQGKYNPKYQVRPPAQRLYQTPGRRPSEPVASDGSGTGPQKPPAAK